jgi:hypothetical protein
MPSNDKPTGLVHDALLRADRVPKHLTIVRSHDNSLNLTFGFLAHPAISSLAWGLLVRCLGFVSRTSRPFRDRRALFPLDSGNLCASCCKSKKGTAPANHSTRLKGGEGVHVAVFARMRSSTWRLRPPHPSRQPACEGCADCGPSQRPLAGLQLACTLCPTWCHGVSSEQHRVQGTITKSVAKGQPGNFVCVEKVQKRRTAVICRHHSPDHVRLHHRLAKDSDSKGPGTANMVPRFGLWWFRSKGHHAYAPVPYWNARVCIAGAAARKRGGFYYSVNWS